VAKKKVIFIIDQKTDQGLFQRGDEALLPSDIADVYVKRGIAEYVNEIKAVKMPSPEIVKKDEITDEDKKESKSTRKRKRYQKDDLDKIEEHQKRQEKIYPLGGFDDYKSDLGEEVE